MVTERVVDLLEAVEVEGDESDRFAGPGRDAQCLFRPVAEEDAVGEAGKRIVRGLVVAALRRTLDPPLVADQNRGTKHERPEVDGAADLIGYFANDDEAIKIMGLTRGIPPTEKARQIAATRPGPRWPEAVPDRSAANTEDRLARVVYRP